MSNPQESLVDMIEHSVRTFAARPVFGEHVRGAWSWMTYAELGTSIDEVRSGLAALGVGAGERIAIISRNSSAWAIAAFATYGLGSAFVPMYEMQRHDDWELILRDSGASVVFVRTPDLAAVVEGLRGGLPALRHVITVEGPHDHPMSFEGLRRLGREHLAPPVRPAPEAIASFVYTSGTTGRPKGVMLSHANVISNLSATMSRFPIGADDRSLSFLPWAHAYGQAEMQSLVSLGASLALNQELPKLVDNLQEIRPTMLVAVPRIFNRIHDRVRTQIASKPPAVQRLFDRGVAASIKQRRGERLGLVAAMTLWLANLLVFRPIRAKFGGRLRYAITGSGSLAREVAEFVDALRIDVYEGYGLTEASPIVTANYPGQRKLGSVGKPIDGVTVRIDDTVGNQPGVGEIVVYGPNVMKGYHARPEENARAFTADGGLRTGDLGYLDHEGYLFITGRIKEQYKLQNGMYVVPTPLEEQLALSPFITTVMLVGDARPYNVALVVVDQARVRAWAADHHVEIGFDLPRDPMVHEMIARELEQRAIDFRPYERPRAFLITDEEFTTENGMLTPSLKLKRHNVLARYGEALDQLYEQPISVRSSLAASESPPPAPPAAAPHAR